MTGTLRHVLAAMGSFVAVVVAVSARAADITHGPFVGHTTADSVRVWARFDTADEYGLVVIDERTKRERRVDAGSHPDDDLCVVWTVEGLSAARAFRYRIELPDGRAIDDGAQRFTTRPRDDEASKLRVVLGSCARTDAASAATWKRIGEVAPDAVVLLGDTPYIDSTEISVLREKHREFASFEPMAAVLRSTPYYSVWDDHDFGKNDVDGRLPGKESSRQVFREYRPNPSCGDGREGIYTRFRAGALDVFLLDTRYFAACEPSPVDSSKPTLLGSAQWEWLCRELRASTAPFKLLASGMIWNAATRPGKTDQWETYAHERDALWRFLGEEKITGVVLAGGDVHRSRALRHPTRELAGYELLELITSPMHGSVITTADASHPALLHDAGVPSSFLVIETDTTHGPARLVARALDASGRELFAVAVEADGSVRSLRPCADLPPLLEFADGRPVRSSDEWRERRAEIRQLLEEHFVGSPPSVVPGIASSEVLDEQRSAGGALRRHVRIVLDAPAKPELELRVAIPPGDGPFPLLLTQPRDYQIPWAELALARGWAFCLYPGLDSHHREAEFPGWETAWERVRAAYPSATWTEISCKAWIASRALDWVLAPLNGYPLAREQVAIIGFSRYGKQSLVAAAFDERIQAVVARSPGSPASSPYRFTSRDTFAEAPADFPSEWFLPSLRAFTGREDELPIDAHGWYALIAPRRCRISSAYQDGGEPTFAVERGYLAGREAYRFLGHPENLRVDWREGGHAPISVEHRARDLDWLDLAFGRGAVPGGDPTRDAFPEVLLHDFDLAAWTSRIGAGELRSPFASSRASDDDDRRARIRWVLGWPRRTGKDELTLALLSDAESALMAHDRWALPGTKRIPVAFGRGVRGNIYCPDGAPSTTPAPLVIWLHPFSYASGYSEGYGVEGTTIYHRLAAAGFVVLAYDQCGFGSRLLEGPDFYGREPRWSRLGRMVDDAQAALDSFVDQNGGIARDALPAIDRSRVFVVGFSLGGNVALHTAALDERVTAVASFAGFTPMRSDRVDEPTGGLRRLSQWHALAPKLVLFEGHENELPYDFDDVLSLVAPRPCLLVTPEHDRSADIRDIRQCVAVARKTWKAKDAEGALDHREPDDSARFQRDQQNELLEWLRALAR